MCSAKEWPNESRIDIISQNGNSGEHYEILDKQNEDEKMAIVPKVKLLNAFAKVPKKGSPEAAGYDVYCTSSGVISFGITTEFSTGIAIEIPFGYVASVKPRSGLAFGGGVDSMAGTVDSDYNGEIRILLTSLRAGESTYIRAGERIAQLIIQKVENENDFEVIEEFSRETERGENGFGSTGNE